MLTAEMLTTGRVEIDAETHDHVFDALIRTDTRWNGWAIPYFDLPTALRINAMLGRGDDGGTIFLDSDGRTVIVVEAYNSDREGDPAGEEVYVERHEPLVIDGTDRYCIGGYAWTWQEVEADAPTDPAALDAWLTHRIQWSRAYCDAANALNRARIAVDEPYDAAFRTAQEKAATHVANTAVGAL